MARAKATPEPKTKAPRKARANPVPNKKPEFKPPKSLAQCADMLYETRQNRLAMQKEVDEMEKREGILREHLIENLPVSDATGISGKLAHAKIEKKDVPVVNDWPKLYKHILATKSFDLLQKRLSKEAVDARWEKKKPVPGVGIFHAKIVSLTKR